MRATAGNVVGATRRTSANAKMAVCVGTALLKKITAIWRMNQVRCPIYCVFKKGSTNCVLLDCVNLNRFSPPPVRYKRGLSYGNVSLHVAKQNA